MSFSLVVYATAVPNLWARWAEALAAQGLLVRSRRGFMPDRWRGGWASFGVTVQGGDRRYPSHAIVAGFELDVGPNEEADRLVTGSFLDPGKDDWVAEAGEFEVLLGASSRDIRLKEKFRLLRND